MTNFADAEEVITNIITPPDFVDNDNHTVVLIDPTSEDIDRLSEFFRNAQKSYNVYLYQNGMNDIDWLNSALSSADAFIVNTAVNDLSPIKDHITASQKTWYYGPKNFLGNNQRIKNPENYFLDYENNSK